jgi:hypothetical protein
VNDTRSPKLRKFLKQIGTTKLARLLVCTRAAVNGWKQEKNPKPITASRAKQIAEVARREGVHLTWEDFFGELCGGEKHCAACSREMGATEARA